MAAWQFQSRKGANLRNLDSARSILNEHKTLAIGVLVGFFIVFSLKHYLKEAVVLALLAFIAVFSTLYKRFMRVPPAVELVTFATVMAGVAYGPVTGALFGAIITVVAEIMNSGIDAFIIGYVPGRAAVGFVSAFFPTANMVTLGLLMSILYNAVAQPLYAFQSDAELRFKLLAFVVVNISFNFIIFSLLGNFVRGIIV
ncbi:hypothetical protein HYY73_01830 [Candidatus Woesearchaeota archaeon]|nr:hypothetical protein [Candidatus Woesearchaeota archaeon]